MSRIQTTFWILWGVRSPPAASWLDERTLELIVIQWNLIGHCQYELNLKDNVPRSAETIEFCSWRPWWWCCCWWGGGGRGGGHSSLQDSNEMLQWSYCWWIAGCIWPKDQRQQRRIEIRRYGNSWIQSPVTSLANHSFLVSPGAIHPGHPVLGFSIFVPRYTETSTPSMTWTEPCIRLWAGNLLPKSIMFRYKKIYQKAI